MGLLVKGKWQNDWYDTDSTNGEFVRDASAFRSQITNDGSSPFQPEAGRYHLYVSLACPWAHRTLIFRKLKNLDDLIDVTVVSPDMLDEGWVFDKPEPLFGFTHLHQIYTHAKADYTGRVTVPVLWDKKTATIVNNESAEIIRIFNSAFNEITGNHNDYAPAPLLAEIDEINDFVYRTVNNGVYRCGFATSQTAYNEAFDDLFKALDDLDARLDHQRYLVGSTLTEADWRLFTTLVRFDAVYVGHFKCNKRRIQDYPNLSNYLRDLYRVPGIAETVNMDQIKRHYYYSHEKINPTRIIPQGPEQNFMASHDRARFDP